MHDWIIFYGDGTRFPAEDAAVGKVRPEDAPRENVQAIAIADPIKAPDCRTHGRWVCEAYDFYMYSDGVGWHGTNRMHDVLDHMKQGLGEGGMRVILTGRWIGVEEYKDIMKRANTEGPFHPRSMPSGYPRSGVEESS